MGTKPDPNHSQPRSDWGYHPSHSVVDASPLGRAISCCHPCPGKDTWGEKSPSPSSLQTCSKPCLG